MSRERAETMPAVTVPPRPKGLPMATTQSPMRVASESPQAVDGSGFLASTFSSARSVRSEEHTSELQSLMRISYAVFCLKKKKKHSTKAYDDKQTATLIHKINNENHTQHM